MMTRALAISGLTALGAAGCAGPAAPSYRVADMLRIDAELINILVETRAPGGAQTASRYADCVAARVALDQGFGFARNVRTSVQKSGGTWTADAVYSISRALPAGSRTIDAEVVVQNCAETSIPTG